MSVNPGNSANEKLDVLFTQLAWPSGLVRERACGAIADLLGRGDTRDLVFSYLCRWAKSQVLESVTDLALLALLKSANSGVILDEREEKRLAACIRRRSLLSRLLLRELCRHDLPPEVEFLHHSGDSPSTFEPSPFFRRYIKAFLPPIYLQHAKQLTEKCGLPFVRQWAYEWTRLVEQTGVELSTQPLNFWLRTGRDGYPHYVAVDTVMSEVYRSAFLRSLSWAADRKETFRGELSFFAAQCCPVDLDLWRLLPARKPLWWPRVDESSGTIDTVPEEVWKDVRSLFEDQRRRSGPGDREDIVACASGRVLEGSAIYDLQIAGAFQKCLSLGTPETESIASWLLRETQDSLPPIYSDSALHFEGSVPYRSPGDLSENFNGWSLVPVSCRVLPLGVPRWQFWRIRRDIVLPGPWVVGQALSYQVTHEAIVAKAGETVVGKWSDWTEGLEQKMVDNVPPRTGQVLLVPRTIVDEFAARTNSSFCWICRLTVYSREYEYEPYESIQDHQVFGASMVVR